MIWKFIQTDHFTAEAYRDEKLAVQVQVQLATDGFAFTFPVALLGEFSQLVSDLEDALGEEELP